MALSKGFIFFFCLTGMCALSTHAHATTGIDALSNSTGWALVMNQESQLNESAYQKNTLSGAQLETTIYLLRNAISLYNGGRYGASLQKITQVYSLSTQLQNQGLLARSLILKANCLANLGLIKESSNTLAEGKIAIGNISDSDLKHDNLAAFYRAQALIMVQKTKLNKWPGSIFYQYQKAVIEQSEIKGTDFKSGQVISDYYISEYYLSNNKPDSARHYLYRSLKYSVEKGWNEYIACIYYRLGYLRFKQKDHHTAIDHYLFALSLAEEHNNEYQKKYIYLALSNVYSDFGSIEKADMFLKKYILCADELLKTDKKTITFPVNYLGNVQERVYMDKCYLCMLWGISISNLLVLLIIVSTWLYKHLSRVRISKQQTAGILQNNIELIKDQQPAKKTTKIEIQEVFHMATLNDPSFFVKFKELEPEFINKLLQIAPNLVASELELCAYLRLNFETKEIARYTLLSVRAVQGKKHRIRKKLMVSPLEDLNLWMLQL